MKELILKNFTLKVLALLSAATFWFIIMGLQNIPRIYDQPLKIKAFNLSDESVVVGELPSAQISIITDKETQRSLRPEDFDAYIDLKHATPGNITSNVYVTSKNPKVTVTSIKPETITIRLEEKFGKDVPVEVKVQGKVHDGYEIKSVYTSPATITLLGSESRLLDIHEARVALQLTGQESTSFKMTQRPIWDGDGKSLSDLELDPESVEVSVEIIPKTVKEETVSNEIKS